MNIRRLLGTVVKASAVSLAGLVALGVLGVSPAGAATMSSSGSIGTATIPQGVCRYLGAWNQLNIETAPPSIYARNNRPGAGNDSQWVRYQVFLEVNGKPVRASSYSGFAIAYDNSPAKFSGLTTFAAVPDGSRLLVGIEWWNSTTKLGELVYRVDSYIHYSNNVGPYGPMSSCARW